MQGGLNIAQRPTGEQYDRPDDWNARYISSCDAVRELSLASQSHICSFLHCQPLNHNPKTTHVAPRTQWPKVWTSLQALTYELVTSLLTIHKALWK
jgi:hypothetical protein